MFRCLILFLFFYSTISFSQKRSEIVEFSNSIQWKKILYIENEKSLVKSDQFFLAPKKKWSSLNELIYTIESFKNKRIHINNMLAECIFMGRKNLILKKWPKLFEQSECLDFKEWEKNLDVEDLYLVFTSAYPNNPASMFGHTFLRFDRKSKGEQKETKELLGYAFSYQAQTNQSDNPIEYTFKGLTGGYYSYLEIKPHYINVGIYNNSESRDTWEYKLNLTGDEKKLFLEHAWEISITGIFSYYFFDENCSTSLLRHLEVIRPEINLTSKSNLFVVPQVTLREIVKKYNSNIHQFVPSIKRRIEHNYVELNKAQKKKFSQGKENLKLLNKVNDEEVLNSLVDYWKWKNYQSKTNLSNVEKVLMLETFKKRSIVENSAEKHTQIDIMEQRPDLGHKLSKFRIGSAKKSLWLGLRYGFHDFYDNSLGHSDSSFIRFLDIELERDKNKKTNYNADLVDIISLQNYYFYLPQISWRVLLNHKSKLNRNETKLLGGLGLSHNYETQRWFGFLTLNSYHNETVTTIHPGLNIAYKKIISKNLSIILEFFTDNYWNEKQFYMSQKETLTFSNYFSSYSLFFLNEYESNKIGIEYSFHF